MFVFKTIQLVCSCSRNWTGRPQQQNMFYADNKGKQNKETSPNRNVHAPESREQLYQCGWAGSLPQESDFWPCGTAVEIVSALQLNAQYFF